CIGTANPTAVERYTLAHELTHALDDQYFDLSRLDTLGNTCRDEALQAATGTIEGSAVYFSTKVLFRFFSRAEQQQVVGQSGPSPAGIPQFVLNMETWPYVAGPSFIAALEARGGNDAVDAALRHLPVATSPVMEPARLPGDVPTPIDIPDVGPKLGKGWRDLDVEEVGAEFLNAW